MNRRAIARVRGILFRRQDGQAAAETAVVIMTFLMTVLGIIQISLIMNAKLMTNYAAYCAARAGIVYNGNQRKMEQAAAIALSPLFTKSARGLLFGYAAGFATMQVTNAEPEWLTDLIGFGLRVERMSPGNGRFSSNYRGRFFPTHDVVFGNIRDLDDNLLKVKVTYNFPLEVPFINTIMRPFFSVVPHAKIVSVCRMRMQSDAQSE
jgi:hypothetical protein